MADSSSQPISVKSDYNGELRRFQLTKPTYLDLLARLQQVHNIPNSCKILIQYKDDEGDLISLSTCFELEEAIEICGCFSGNLLRLFLSRRDEVMTETVPTVRAEQPTDMHAEHHGGWGNGGSVGVAGSGLAGIGGGYRHHHHHRGGRRFDQGWGPATTAQRGCNRSAYSATAAEASAGEYNMSGERKDVKKELRDIKVQKKEIKRSYKEEKRLLKKEKKFAMKDFHARFVKHVTISDGLSMSFDQKFVKTWRFRNEGRCSWPADAKLVFVSKQKGDQLGALPEVPLGSVVEVNQEVDVSVDMVSPSQPGEYCGYWRLALPCGRKFGQRVWVRIQVLDASAA